MSRLYILKYKIYFPRGGLFKYAPDPNFEERIEYYQQDERDKWIKAYKNINSPAKSHYIEDVVCYYTDTFTVVDMDTVINAI